MSVHYVYMYVYYLYIYACILCIHVCILCIYIIDRARTGENFSRAIFLTFRDDKLPEMSHISIYILTNIKKIVYIHTLLCICLSHIHIYLTQGGFLTFRDDELPEMSGVLTFDPKSKSWDSVSAGISY